MFDRVRSNLMSQSPSQPLVLIVEDDVLARMGASDMFLDAGYRVIEAEHADEALRFFETGEDIAVLFTDVTMPGSINGSDLARQVAKQWPMVGIIMVSGHRRPDKLPSSIRFHDKPYEPTAVLRQAREMTTSLG
jgi:two-component system, response regulator PdtaR